MGLTDPLERKIMATGMKASQDQIDLIRKSKAKNEEPESQEEPKEDLE